MKERHFLSKNMFSENAVEYLRTLWMLELSNLCYCVQHPWKLTSRDFWSSRNERKALSQQKCVLRSNWSLGVHILRDIAEIGWASQNWMISSETPEMGHETFRTVTIVFSTPENLLVGISGALGMKESHSLNKNVCLRKCCRGISEMVNARAFKPLPLCSAPLKTY